MSSLVFGDLSGEDVELDLNEPLLKQRRADPKKT